MAFLALRRRVLSWPRLWLALLLWPILVLLLILAPLGIYHCTRTSAGALLSAAAISAVACLIVLALIARHSYLGIREVRNKLFDGYYESALEAARHNPAVGKALGFEKALVRMLEFDSRRADRVAAITRLLDSFLQESTLPFFIADLEEDIIHLSKPARRLFGVNVERFSLLSLLLLPANKDFARVYNPLTKGDRQRADVVLTLHLPVRQAVRKIAARMLAVQDDQGKVLYVLGFISAPGAQPQPTPSPAADPEGTQPEPRPPEGTPDATAHD